jgi:hypothetical protein
MAAAPQPAATVAAPVTAAPVIRATLTWDAFLGHFKATRPRLASLLEHASAHRMPTSEENVLEVVFNEENSFKAEQLQSRELILEINQYLAQATGSPAKISAIVRKDVGESTAQRAGRERREREDQARNAVQNHPVIREARALFGGELSAVERDSGPAPQGAHP